MRRHRIRAQRELFATAEATSGLPAQVQQDLLILLEVLLLEAMTGEVTAQEGADEQDHA